LQEALVREAKRARVDAYVWRNLLRNRSRAYVDLQKESNRILQEQEIEIVDEIETKNKALVESLQQEIEEWREKAEMLEQKDDDGGNLDETLQENQEDILEELKALREQRLEDKEELLSLRKECNHWLRMYEILRNTTNTKEAPTAPLPEGIELLRELERWKEEAASWKQEAQMWRSREVEVTGGQKREKTPTKKEKPEPPRLIDPGVGQTLGAHRQRIFELERELLLQRKRVEKWKTRCMVNQENYNRKIASHEIRFEDLSQALKLYEESLFVRGTVGSRSTTRGLKGQGSCRTEIGHTQLRTTFA